MKKPVKNLLFIAIFILLAVFVDAQQIVVSVSDFNVESEHSTYKFIGKGISTLVAGELRRSKSVKILERSQIKTIMEEQKLSLTGLVDENHQVELGKLLAADYIVFGEIIDMGNSLLVSVRMADVATSEVVWEDSLSEKLETYDYIGAYFAKSILTELKLDVQKEIVAKVENKVEKEPEAIVALSAGVDAYDRGDEEKAKEELQTAKKLDPENETVKFYLSKLVAISPKFKVESEQYAPLYNPASLGIITQDRFYTWSSMRLNDKGLDVGDGYFAEESVDVQRTGYALPFGDRFGIGIEYYSGHFDNNAGTSFDSGDLVSTHPMNKGAYMNIGYSILNNISIGTSLGLYYTEETKLSAQSYLNDKLNVAIDVGLILSWLDENIIFDTHAVYTTQETLYYSLIDNSAKKGQLPVIMEDTLTFRLLNKSLYLGLKSIANINIDSRGGYSFRAIPFTEYWIFPFIAVRAAYENSHVNEMGKFAMGHGFLIGSTINIWKFDININYTNRVKALSVLPGYTARDDKFLIGLTFYPGWMSR